jgi:hypothetical protein
MTIGLTWRRTARRIKRLKEGVFTISPDYSDRDPRLFGALVRSQPVVRPIGANLSGSRSVPALHLFKGEQTETVRLTL